jgi:hypothetical protein
VPPVDAILAFAAGTAAWFAEQHFAPLSSQHRLPAKQHDEAAASTADVAATPVWLHTIRDANATSAQADNATVKVRMEMSFPQ